MLLAAMLLLSSANGTHLWPGAVATDGVAFLTAREGGIQAIDLENGKRLWISQSAQWPLEVVGDVLVAARHQNSQNKNELSFASLATTDATVKARSTTTLPLLESVTARPSYDQPHEFDIESSINGAGKIVIRWSASRVHDIGIAPNPGLLQSQPAVVFGSLLVDPVTSGTAIANLPPENGVHTFPNYAGNDPIDRRRSILWPPTTMNHLRIYAVEKVSISHTANAEREITAVAVDASTGALRWQVPIALCYQRLRM